MDRFPPPSPPPSLPPHVLIFPLPLQGPINSMLKLAELLCLAGVRVTFLNTLHNHRRLLRFSAAASRFALYSDLFRFETFPDGLPEHHSRSGDSILELFTSVESSSKPLLREILSAGAVSCVIVSDGIFGFAVDVAEEIGVPVFYFATISPCCLWIYMCLPKLIHARELPISGDEMDEPIRSVPGMEAFLRRRDLPSFYRVSDLSDPIIQLVLVESTKIHRARGLILDTFEELEAPALLSHMRATVPNLYAVGPLHSLLRSRAETASSSSNNSLWEEDPSCIAWLHAQPPRSVVYVSIGSLAVMTAAEAAEFRHGLASSGKRFLWVRRPGSVVNDGGDGDDPADTAEEDLNGGFVVRWAPQEEVLSHSSVGAFITHSGWNSTLESIVAGVPMICWPYFVDQQVNSRHVSHVWGLGLDMKDTCDRATVEAMVRDLMEVRRDHFFESAQRTARLARESVERGGSSWSNLDRLIDDIKLMRI